MAWRIVLMLKDYGLRRYRSTGLAGYRQLKCGYDVFRTSEAWMPKLSV